MSMGVAALAIRITGDPFEALLLVLDLIDAGKLKASSSGLVLVCA